MRNALFWKRVYFVMGGTMICQDRLGTKKQQGNDAKKRRACIHLISECRGATTKVDVDDLWEVHSAGKVASGSLELTIFPHDTKLLQLTKA